MNSKSGERVLKELGAMLRREEEDEFEQRALWALCAGELSSAEREELEQSALADPELARALDAYRPLEAGAVQQVEALFLARASTSESAKLPRQASRKRVSARTSRRLWPYGVVAASAAAIAVYLTLPSHGTLDIPEYVLSAHSAKTQRSSAAEATSPQGLVVSSETPVHVFLRPAHAVSHAVTARVCLYEGSKCNDWPAQLEVDSAGSVHISLEPLHASVRAGAELWIVVGAPERLGGNMAELALAHRPSRGVQGWRIPLHNLAPQQSAP